MSNVRLCCDLPLGPGDPDHLIARAETAVTAGASLLVISELEHARPAVAALTRLRNLLDPSIRILARGRVGLAWLATLDGVHLSQSDIAPRDARRLLGSGATIGIELENPTEADELVRWRVDLACIGTADHLPSPDLVARIAFRIRLAAPGTPVVAWVGADPDAVPQTVDGGVDGVMVRFRPGDPDWHGSLRRIRATLDAAIAIREAGKVTPE